ncbi:MAG: Arylsulfatase [Clostridia bacterium]|nr:Arylsulfatase [Clostridia bacterium]
MKKNILLLFTDQQRFDTIRSGILQTPNLDALCNEGVCFNRAFTPSPVCVPARLSMMYGIYPISSSCTDNERCDMSYKKNIFQILGENGYYTHGIGKMHFSDDLYGFHGFTKRETQEEITGQNCNDDYRKYLDDNGFTHVFDHHGQRSEMYYIPQISQLPAKHHPTAWVGERSVNFIKEYNEDKPFLLMSSFVHPHPPFAPPTPWNKLYRMLDMSSPFVPENPEELLTYYNKVQNRYKCIDDGINKYTLKTLKAFYYACISFIDYQIGRIITALKEKGIYDDTLIIFTSDHGEMLGDYNCLGKRTMLDSACKIPLIIKGDDFKRNATCENPASLVDIMPTILSYAGIDYSNEVFEGEELCTIANGNSSRKYVFSQYSSRNDALYMIASKNEKYIYSVPDCKDIFFGDKGREEKNQYSIKNKKALELKAALFKEYLHEKDFSITEPRIFPYDDEKQKGHLYQDHWGLHDLESVIPEGYHVNLH